jgi:hypothetical protein
MMNGKSLRQAGLTVFCAAALKIFPTRSLRQIKHLAAASPQLP